MPLGLVDVCPPLLGQLEKPLERVLLLLILLLVLPRLVLVLVALPPSPPPPPPPLLRHGVLVWALFMGTKGAATSFLGGSGRYSNLVSLLDITCGR